MKKKTLLLTALILIPLAMGMLSAMPAVMVTDGETTWYSTFMDPIEGSRTGWFPYAAAVLNYTVLGLVVVFAFLKKEWCLHYAMWMSAGACFLISATLWMQGELRIIPNFISMFLTGGEGMLAYYISKHPDLVGGIEEEKDFRIMRR